MTPEQLQRAWVQQAQLDAERGIIACRVCRRPSSLEHTLTVWRNGVLVFALCDGCSAAHDVLLHPTDAGVEIRARARTPLIVGSTR